MIGDAEDVRIRLRLTLPAHWFADSAPVLDGVLAGLAALWSGFYGLLQYVRLQTRVGSSTDDFLDITGRDYFSAPIVRRTGEGDTAFRARLLRAMRRERATKAGLIAAAAEAGFSLQIFEPAQPADTGAYNTVSGLAWSVAGGWGSMQMPFECLITANGGTGADKGELLAGIGEAMPAGGAGWIHITG